MSEWCFKEEPNESEEWWGVYSLWGNLDSVYETKEEAEKMANICEQSLLEMMTEKEKGGQIYGVMPVAIALRSPTDPKPGDV